MQKTITLIGREEETEKIDILLLSPQAEFLAVYGRRRVGKTFLIRQYLKDNIAFDITGTQHGDKGLQLTNFFDEYLKKAKIKKNCLSHPAGTKRLPCWRITLKDCKN